MRIRLVIAWRDHFVCGGELNWLNSPSVWSFDMLWPLQLVSFSSREPEESHIGRQLPWIPSRQDISQPFFDQWRFMETLPGNWVEHSIDSLGGEASNSHHCVAGLGSVSWCVLGSFSMFPLFPGFNRSWVNALNHSCLPDHHNRLDTTCQSKSVEIGGPLKMVSRRKWDFIRAAPLKNLLTAS
jgi:hypothetical protein